MVSQDEIHRMVQSKNWSERNEAAKLIGKNFHLFPDIDKVWDDLHRLTLDKTPDVRVSAVVSLGIAFPNVPDKNKAWKDLHRLTKLKEEYVREFAALSIGKAFSNIPDKKQAWEDLHRLVYDEEPEVCESAAMSLNTAFSDIPDKKQAWNDLIWLARYDDYDVRFQTFKALGNAYKYILKKEESWEEMLTFVFEEDFFVSEILFALGEAFPYHPNKKQAWNDLHSFTQESNEKIRGCSMYPIATNFTLIPDKKQALDDINMLLQDQKSNVRWNATLALGEIITHVPDKKVLFNAIYNSAYDNDREVRSASAHVLANIFHHVPDKELAWIILIKLTQDNDSYVQGRAVYGIGFAYPHIPYKKQALSILIRLTHSDDRFVSEATSDIESVLPEIIDKNQNMDIKIELSSDERLRSLANHSLGRISIYKATLTENDNRFREELEKALGYFENSAKETTLFNPARFCLPFYRSFYTVTFRKEESEAEVKKYIEEAKNAVGGSKSKEKLLEAIENLSNALTEAQKARSIGEIQSDLTVFSRYCNRAADLLGETEGHAPGAVKLIRRGLPIIDERIKKILGDIEEKSKDFCKDSKQTPFENISRKTYENVKGLGELNSPLEAEIMLNKSIPLWRSVSTILPKESGVFINELLDEMEIAELDEKAKTNLTVVSTIIPQMLNLQEKLSEQDKLIEYLKDTVTLRLDNINYSVFKIKHRSSEMSLALNQVQIELKKINKIKNDLDNIGINLEELGESQNQNFKELNDGMNNICNIIESEILPKLPENDDKQKILDKIDELKQSEAETLFNRVAGFSSIIGLILPFLL